MVVFCCLRKSRFTARIVGPGGLRVVSANQGAVEGVVVSLEGCLLVGPKGLCVVSANQGAVEDVVVSL